MLNKTELQDLIKQTENDIMDTLHAFETETGLRVREDGMALWRSGVSDNPSDAITSVRLIFTCSRR